jgi:hypothetical protein
MPAAARNVAGMSTYESSADDVVPAAIRPGQRAIEAARIPLS